MFCPYYKRPLLLYLIELMPLIQVNETRLSLTNLVKGNLAVSPSSDRTPKVFTHPPHIGVIVKAKKALN